MHRPPIQTLSILGSRWFYVPMDRVRDHPFSTWWPDDRARRWIVVSAWLNVIGSLAFTAALVAVALISGLGLALYATLGAAILTAAVCLFLSSRRLGKFLTHFRGGLIQQLNLAGWTSIESYAALTYASSPHRGGWWLIPSATTLMIIVPLEVLPFLAVVGLVIGFPLLGIRYAYPNSQIVSMSSLQTILETSKSGVTIQQFLPMLIIVAMQATGQAFRHLGLMLLAFTLFIAALIIWGQQRKKMVRRDFAEDPLMAEIQEIVGK